MCIIAVLCVLTSLFCYIKASVFFWQKFSAIACGNGAREGEHEQGAGSRCSHILLPHMPGGRELELQTPSAGPGQVPEPVGLARPGQHQGVQVGAVLSAHGSCQEVSWIPGSLPGKGLKGLCHLQGYAMFGDPLGQKLFFIFRVRVLLCSPG